MRFADLLHVFVAFGIVIGIFMYIRWVLKIRKLIEEYEARKGEKAVLLRLELRNTSLSIAGFAIFWPFSGMPLFTMRVSLL